MKTLLVLRHASRARRPGLDDHDRPLKQARPDGCPAHGTPARTRRPRSRRDPLLVALRARETAERVAREAGFAGPSAARGGSTWRDRKRSSRRCASFRSRSPWRWWWGTTRARGPGRGARRSGERLTTCAVARLDVPVARWADLEVRSDAVLARSGVRRTSTDRHGRGDTERTAAGGPGARGDLDSTPRLPEGTTMRPGGCRRRHNRFRLRGTTAPSSSSRSGRPRPALQDAAARPERVGPFHHAFPRASRARSGIPPDGATLTAAGRVIRGDSS